MKLHVLNSQLSQKTLKSSAKHIYAFYFSKAWKQYIQFTLSYIILKCIIKKWQIL